MPRGNETFVFEARPDLTFASSSAMKASRGGGQRHGISFPPNPTQFPLPFPLPPLGLTFDVTPNWGTSDAGTKVDPPEFSDVNKVLELVEDFAVVDFYLM